jgi:predicted Zn-dependent protease
MASKNCIFTYAVAAVVVAVAAYAAHRPGEPLKPGFNVFSKEQDVQLGETNAKQVTAQYQVADNQFLQDYVRRVGSRLSRCN